MKEKYLRSLYNSLNKHNRGKIYKSINQAVFSPCNEPWGMRTSFVTDPEGNLIEIGSWGKGNEA